MSDGRAVPEPRTSSYRDILHSTALIGASSVIAMFFSLIRMKTLAILLGPTGVGTVALLSSVVDVVVALAGLGVSQSGVRQIARTEGSNDRGQMAATVRTVQRTSLVLGLFGGLALAALSVPLAVFTFGGAEYATALAVLGLVVLLRILTGGETALLQGTRRILDLAKLNIVTSIAGVLIAIPIVFVWREAAIVPLLVLTALAGWATARWYSSRAAVSEGPVRSVPGEVGELIRLGVAFTISGFLTMGAAYAIRLLVQQDAGIEAAGFYQAAWAIAGLYVGVVLQSMGTDFYPRLTAVVGDNIAVTRLVGEQTQVSLLLAAPGVTATITFSYLLVTVFYSPEFSPAASLLRWLSLGMMLRVITWPMGYIIVAKGWQKLFITTEVVATVVHVGLAAALVPVVGVDGAGVAFLCLYLCHGVLVYVIVRRSCGYRLSAENVGLMAFFGLCCALAFVGFIYLPFWWATLLGLAMTCATGLFSLFALLRLVPAGALPKPIRSLLSSMGVSPAV
ncbi:MAG: O-antigen translocase [Devosia sp.]|uniref:O-antigen translocase n=1 Tax=Devosia sp. TaxID=1871048 RepID=UPI0033940C67